MKNGTICEQIKRNRIKSLLSGYPIILVGIVKRFLINYMVKLRLFVLVSILSFVRNVSLAQESDSIKVYFVGYNSTGEKFDVRYGGTTKLRVSGRGTYKYSFFIPVANNPKYGDPLNINILEGRLLLFLSISDI
jgi:hypothetical protein